MLCKGGTPGFYDNWTKSVFVRNSKGCGISDVRRM